MKKYIKPKEEVVVFDVADVVSTSTPVENEPNVHAAPTTDYDLL